MVEFDGICKHDLTDFESDLPLSVVAILPASKHFSGGVCMAASH